MTPVAAICADTATPCMPSPTTSEAMSTYQATPSPRRLMVEKNLRVPLRAHRPLTRTHMAASADSGRSSLGEGSIDGSGTRERGEHGFEVGGDLFGSQPQHGLARGHGHSAAQHRFARQS